MTSKERAALRGEANTLEPLFQVGKGGVTQAVINQVEDAFNTKELIKIKVLLDTSPDAPKITAAQLAEATGSQVVQVIGGSIILYRVNAELRKAQADKKKRQKEQLKAKREKEAAAKKSSMRTGYSPYNKQNTASRQSSHTGRSPKSKG